MADGKLSMPTHEQELDGGAVGPVNFLGQDLPALGDEWTFETQFTVKHNGGWQHVGLMVWNGDNNLFRSTITHNQGTGAIYVEQSKDNPTSTEGARVQAGGNVNLPRRRPGDDQDALLAHGGGEHRRRRSTRSSRRRTSRTPTG